MGVLCAKTLMEEAVSSCGLKDFGPPQFLDNFEQLIASLNKNGSLHEAGLEECSREFLNLLNNRLEIQHWVTAYPEILQEKIDRPVFATGLPRSGTTFMLHLFDHDERLQLLRTWETGKPCPPPGIAPETIAGRIEKTRNDLAAIWQQSVPNFDAIHLIDVEGPDECALLLNNDFAQVGFLNYLNVPEYFDWMTKQGDFSSIYAYHKKQLQLLQWKRPKKRWVVKYPNHLLAMNEINSIYTDPVFVMTHRDPVKTLASLCNLTANFRAARSDNIDNNEIGRQIFSFIKVHIERLLEYCRANPHQIFHVNYYRLVGDPLAEMTSVYDFIGLDMPNTVNSQLNSWVDDNPQGKRGVHSYSLEDFGLSRQRVERSFSEYRLEYDIAVEG